MTDSVVDVSRIFWQGGIALAVAYYLVRYLDIKTLHPHKLSIIKKVWIGTFILLLAGNLSGIAFDKNMFLVLFFGLTLVFLYDIIDAPNVKNIFWLLGPFTLVKLVAILGDTFSTSFGNFFDGISEFLVLWIIGFGIYLYRQNKKDVAQRKKDEEARLKLETQNISLEKIVATRTFEISQQKEALEKSMEELKAAQSQLIHSEKMASLGELTAGIAHEIQNPLNFVNNFSDVSRELLEELKQERQKREHERNKELEDELLNDVMLNLTKISHHGHRASSIVKNMLEHSRLSSGEKELIDVNELCDEYLNLSYHGLRAKDQSFNSDFKLDLDPKMPKLKLAPQDLGRVILNLCNNAFYSVKEKSKLNDKDYKPMVQVSTKKLDFNLEIRVKDNGAGIPEEIQDKIFQPFFTTKPTGQGTGLGLSLAYDIITKGHNGTIEVYSDENGTEFVIELPL